MSENENNRNENEIEKVEDKDVHVEEKKKDDGYEKFCFICHRPESVTGKLTDLPNNISVCSDCMQKSFDAMTSGQIDYSKLMNIPGVQIFNMSDLENAAPRQQKVKKKKEGEERHEDRSRGPVDFEKEASQRRRIVSGAAHGHGYQAAL